MNCHEQSRTTRRAPSISALIATSLLLMFLHTRTEANENQFDIHTGYKKFHVSYDVHADASYTETDDLEIAVLTEKGVQMSQGRQAGRPNYTMNMEKMDVVILSAYTRKKNGEHIEAIRSKPLPQPQPQPQPQPFGLPPDGPIPMVFFQNVEVGDTLVLSFKSTQNEPILPNNFSIDHTFLMSDLHEDAVVSLTAPASLNFQVETKNMEKGEQTSSGSNVKWVWKFQNLHPEKLQPNRSPEIRISTYKDVPAEFEAREKHFLLQIPVEKLCMAKPGVANDGPAAGDQLAALIAKYFWDMPEMLDRSVSAWNMPTCVFDDGRPKLSMLNDGYSRIFDNQPDWSKSLARIEDLKKKFPNKAFVALAEVRYWIDYAWDARGGGYASSVTPEGWKLFHERLEKAEKILNETKSYSAEIPTWYVHMIIVQSALGRSEKDRDKTFLEGAKRYRSFYSTYFTMLSYLRPQWGGSWETVDNLVKWSVGNTKEIDGNSMYARLYWVASEEMPEGETLFKNTRASWPKMKKGFEDLMARHPKSNWNLNNFAKFACEAGDKKTFLALRRQVGKNIMDAAWQGNSNLDLCESKFGYTE